MLGVFALFLLPLTVTTIYMQFFKGLRVGDPMFMSNTAAPLSLLFKETIIYVVLILIPLILKFKILPRYKK